ncbi:MAG: WS/DGAT/MGAT family O-acyltransferase [Candidatus Binatia bacterium]
MSAGDRMTALDAAFFNLERTGQLLHVGSVSITERPLDFARLSDDVASRLHLIPRYTQRVVPVPFHLAHPTWEPAPHFDVRQHVFRHQLRPPGDLPQLSKLVSRLFARPLDRERPLWELHQIDGVEGERSALFGKVHHCMIDGVSGVQLMGVLLDPSPKPAPYPPAPPATPRPPLPSATTQLWRGMREGTRMFAAHARALVNLVSRPEEALRELERTGEALGEMLRVVLERVPPTPFNGHVSILRRVLWRTVPLHDLKGIKNRLGGTVNDAVLATIAGALRRYLESHGANPDRVELKAMCPVNVRTEGEHLALGNRISMMVAPLPVGIYDPLERYRQVRAAMTLIKASGESVRMTRILDLVTLLPPPLQSAVGWMQVQSAPVNTICTNVPGPPVALYTQGVRLETLVPLVPLAQGIGLAFAMLSYADTLTIGVTLDPALIRDGERIVECLGESFEELRTLAGIERSERHGPVRSERQRRPTQVA